jgi:hypothetical protein
MHGKDISMIFITIFFYEKTLKVWNFTETGAQIVPSQICQKQKLKQKD